MAYSALLPIPLGNTTGCTIKIIIQYVAHNFPWGGGTMGYTMRYNTRYTIGHATGHNTRQLYEIRNGARHGG